MADANYVMVLLTRDRFVEALQWCEDNAPECAVGVGLGLPLCEVKSAYEACGIPDNSSNSWGTPLKRVFVFSREDDAVLFKLRYG